MTNRTTLADVVTSPSAVRILWVVETAVKSLAHVFEIVQDDFDDAMEGRPTELRVIVPLEVEDVQLRIEVAVLSVTVRGDGIFAADCAFKVTEPASDYNVTIGDHDRLLAGIAHLFNGAAEITPAGYEQFLCCTLPRFDIDA